MGWSAATVSIAVAINVTLYGALGPFAAAVMESFGIRKTILVALAVIALSTTAASFITTPLGLALTWGLGLGIGIGAISMVMVAVDCDALVRRAARARAGRPHRRLGGRATPLFAAACGDRAIG